MKARVRNGLVAACSAVVLTSCSTPAPGSPSPKAPPGASSTTTTPDGSPVAELEPCTLLTDPDRAALGLPASPEEKTFSDRRSCQFRIPGHGTAGVNVYDTVGFESIKSISREVEELPDIGNHKAIRTMSGSICAVSLEITETSVVEGSSGGRTKKKACDLAMRIAETIEPKLP